MNRKKNHDEVGYFEKISGKIKSRVFFTLNELTDSYKISTLTFNFLLILECLQIFFFAFKNNLPYIWDNVGIKYILEVLNYIQFERILEAKDNAIKMSVFYIIIATILAVVMFFILITCNYENKERHNRTLFKYSVKLCCMLLVLHNTIFTIPAFQAIFNMIICLKDSPFSATVEKCYANISLMNLVFAIFGCLLLFSELLFVNLFMHEMNPNSKLPSASFNLNQNVLKFIYKMALCLLSIIDYNGTYRQYIVIGGTVVLAINLFFFRFNYPPLYNSLVGKLSLFIEFFLFYSYLILLVEIYLDNKKGKEPIGFVFIIIGALLTIIFASCLWREKEQKVVKRTVKDLKNQNDVIEFYVMMLGLIKNRDRPSEYMRLQGILKVNLAYLDRNAISGLSILTQVSKTEDRKNEDDAIEMKWFEFLVLVINEAIRKNPKYTQLKLLVAFLYYFKLKNKWKAIYSLTDMAYSKPSVMEQFAGERIVKAIEKELQDLDLKNIDSMGIDILTIFDFKNTFSDFQQNIDKAVRLQIDFWTELMDENPDIQKLISLGSILTKRFEDLEKEFNKLSNYEIHFPAYLDLYSRFLQEILHDDFESKRIMEKLDMMAKNKGAATDLHDDKHDNFSENGSILIITVSGNKENLGEILNVGNEIKYFLKYKTSDVVGNNINMLMPGVYSKHHSDYMKRYLETGEARIIGKKRNIYALDKQGYLKCCSLFLKILPDLSNGIHFIGMIREFDSFTLGKAMMEAISSSVSHYLIYAFDTGKIMGLSESLMREFGLKSAMFKIQSNNTPVLQYLSPDLLNVDIVKDMKNLEKGGTITFDTSSLKDAHYYGGIDDSESYSSQSDSNDPDDGTYHSEDSAKEKMRKFRKAKCKAWITNIETFENEEFYCVRFIEMFQQEDQRNNFKSSNFEIIEMPDKELAKELGKDDNASIAGDEKDNQQEEAIRQIKDSRAMANEKKSVKSIKNLQRLVIVLLLLNIGSEIFLRIQANTELTDNKLRAERFLSLFKRNIILSDIGYYLRKYKLIINDKFVTYTGPHKPNQEEEKNRILGLVKRLESEQIVSSIAHTDIEKSPFKFNYSYTFKQPMTTGKSTDFVSTYSDSVYTLSSAVTITVNSQPESLLDINNTATRITPAEVSFRRYMYNVYSGMRKGGEEYTVRYQDLILRAFKKNFYFGLYYYIGQVAMVIVASYILLRHVFQVMNKNKDLMTLFARISLPDIEKLRQECTDFLAINLRDIQEKDLEEPKVSEEKISSQSSESSSEQPDEVNGHDSMEEARLRKLAQEEVLNQEYASLVPVPPERTLISSLNNTKQDMRRKNKLHPLAEGEKIEDETPKQQTLANNLENSDIEPPPTRANNSTFKSPAYQAVESITLKSKYDEQSNYKGKPKVLKRKRKKHKKKAKKEKEPSEEPKEESKESKQMRTSSNIVKELKGGKTQGAMMTKKEKLQNLEEMERKEEEMNNRINKLKNSKDSNKKMVALKFLCVALFLIALYTLSIVWKYFTRIANEKITRVIYNIGTLANTIKMAFLVFAENLADTALFNSTGKDLFYSIHSQSYKVGDQFSSNLNNYPSGFSNFEKYLRQIMRENICTHYLSTNGFPNCEEDSILMSGLELININLLEDTKKKIDIVDNLAEALRAAQINSWYNSDYLKMEYYLSQSGLAYESLLDNFSEQYAKNIKNMEIQMTLITVFWMLLLIFGFIYLWFVYLKDLSKNISRIEGMLGMIPVEILSKDPKMKEHYEASLAKGVR